MRGREATTDSVPEFPRRAMIASFIASGLQADKNRSAAGERKNHPGIFTESSGITPSSRTNLDRISLVCLVALTLLSLGSERDHEGRQHNIESPGGRS